MLHENITNKIIRAFYNVYKELGYGFLEKSYERAMLIELNYLGCYAENQKNIKVHYKTKEVWDYFADLLVDNVVIVELKAAEEICEEYKIQLMNYLKATKIEVGLLMNFVSLITTHKL